MTSLDFLSIAAAALTLVGVVYSLFQVLSTRKAETELLKKLDMDQSYRSMVQKMIEEEYIRLRQKRNEIAHSAKARLSEKDIEFLVELIRQNMELLDEQAKERIKEALYQPSLEGRSNYVSKLAEESAKNLEHQVQ